ncbi:MAG: hypothetical protein PHC51_12980 [bacterium]|nr:hypothetical protein [bacterium]
MSLEVSENDRRQKDLAAEDERQARLKLIAAANGIDPNKDQSKAVIDKLGKGAETVQNHVRENITVAEGFEQLVKETEKAVFPKDPTKEECRRRMLEKQEEERNAVIQVTQQAEVEKAKGQQTGYHERVATKTVNGDNKA